MNNNPTPPVTLVASTPAAVRTPVRATLALLAVTFAATLSAFGQTANLVVQPTRITVPVSTTTSNGAPYTATLTGVVDPVTLSASSLPAGATASFDINGFTVTTNGVMTINAASVTEGIYQYTLEATGGATNNLALSFQSAYIWTGATFTNGGTADFANSGNWLNGNVPGAAADVVLRDSSAQAAGVLTTNILIASNTEIGSLRDAITAGATRRHNIQINGGTTLKITGTNGLSILRDRSDQSQAAELAFTGTGTLLVSNQNASILLFGQANQNNQLRLENLNLFVADIYRFAISDNRSYPNFESMKANGYTGGAIPQQGPQGRTDFARTNILRSSFAGDPNNWNDPTYREYSMVIGRNEIGGTTQRQNTRLGISNVFMMNSVLFCGSGTAMDQSGGAVIFNSAFTASNPVVVFRGSGGMNDRMTMFAVADGAGPGALSTAAKCVFDLSGGAVDMLVDKMYIARERTNSSGSPPSSSPSGNLTFGKGTVDANHVILGYQGQGNNQGVGSANCQGTVTLNNGVVFRVNQTLELGHTTASAGHTTEPHVGFGQVTVSANSTLMASNITVGGVTKLSADNRVTMSSGGRVIITNAIAGADKKLTVLNMSDSRLVFHVNGALTEPYVYVTNLITGGTSNVIQLATVTGLTSDPQTVKLIAYDSAAPNFSLQLPAGLYGYLENDTVNKTINAVVTATPPKTTIWNGDLSGNWNNSTANWQGAQLFVPGDSARFDDSASGTRAVTIVGAQAVGSGGVTVSNAGPAYSFSGGTIAGTSIMTKQGTGGLTMGCASQLPISIQGGAVTVTGAGSVGLATVSSNASITSAGSVNGFSSAGTAVNTGTILANGANITGGTFYNSGTVTGAVNVTAASATNDAAGSVYTVGISTIATDAVLVNNGGITAIGAGNNRVTVNGLITGTGKVSDLDGYNSGRDGRLAVSGTIAPGNGGIGTFIVEGRFDLNQNANLIVECSISGSATNYDVVGCDYWGAIRGNLVMTNIGPDPFAPGQSFLIVSNNFGLLNNLNINPNADFKFVPPSPGLGMVWDRTDVFTNGIARIKAIPSTPTNLGMSVTTNLMTLSWPESYIGWELHQQIRALTNGISVFATNWTLVANSPLTNQVFITINPNNGAAFYRLAHPAY